MKLRIKININHRLLTLRIHRFVCNRRRDQSPNGVFGGVWLFQSVATLDSDSLLLRKNHIHRLHELSFCVEDIILRHRMDKIIHIGERKIDSTKSTQNRHNSDPDNAYSRNSLLDGEDSSVDTEQWKGITNPPKAVKIAKP